MGNWEDHTLPSDLQAAAWHNLRFGTLGCWLAVLATLLSYLEVWSVLDLVPASAPASLEINLVVLFVLWGMYVFYRSERFRWGAQLALSRLSDYQRRHSDITAPEPDFGRRVKKGTPKEVVQWFAIGTYLTGAGGFAIGSCFLPTPEGFSPQVWWFMRPGFALLGAFAFITSRDCYRRALRLRVGILPSFTPLPAGSYVLYLRNFKDDPRLAKPFPMLGLRPLIPGLFMMARSEEDRIAAALEWAGPVVAVSMPGQRAPNNGILRMDLPDDWHDPVRTLIHDARLVVLVLGPGKGTLWELGEAMRMLPPERLVLINPMKRAKYEQFREVARQELRAQADELRRETGRTWTPPELPDPPADQWRPSRVQGIIHFTQHWRSTYVALPRVPWPEDYLLGALDRALWWPMRRLTARERRIGAAHG